MRKVSILSSFVALGAAAALFSACSEDSGNGVELPKPDAGNNDGSVVDARSDVTVDCPSVDRQDLIGDMPVTNGTKISQDRTLSHCTIWTMKGVVYVPSGVTLTIEAGTEIRGEKSSLATLVVQPGGKLIAEGTADKPIVFTSMANTGKQPGDWGGVILLGRAPINGGKATDGGIEPEAYIEGLPVTPENRYGGSDPNDSSGSLRYVRIEYSGVKIGADNEINGLTLGGVGAGTTLDHIYVRHTLDDCFEFFGGTVNAKYLMCAYNQDDAIDADNGYTGKIQFVVLQQDKTFDDEMNGFEWDNDALGTDGTPLTNPTVYNFTFCGQNASGAKRRFGGLLRRNINGTIRNGLVWGFDAAVDVRDAKTHAHANAGTLTWQNSWFANFKGPGLIAPENIALEETKPEEQAFSETAWLTNPAHNNVIGVDPGFDCQNVTDPNFAPATPITDKAVAPPDDGFFDPTAKYMGAVRDANDTWYKGSNWAKWSPAGE